MTKQALPLSFAKLIIIIILFTSSSCPLYAVKRYTQDEIRITARIHEDGSLLITENRTYKFRGSFTRADYSLPMQDLGRVTDFSLSEGGKTYRESDTKEPGTYFISQTKRKFYVKWFYRASNEVRTFTLKYKVNDAVKAYSDIAEFYYKFISANKPVKVSRVAVDLYFPREADTTQVRAWLHTSINGFYYFANRKIHFEAAPLPKNNFFEVRAIFPTSWVPYASRKFNQERLQLILAEEKRFAEKTNRLRRDLLEKQEFKKAYAPKVKTFSLIALLIGALFYFTLYNRYGKSHYIPGLARISSEIPENLTPALANFFMINGQISGGALTGTLIDLAARGYLKIDEKVEEAKALFFKYKKRTQTLHLDREKYERDAPTELKPHEREYIEFFFNEIGQGRNSITTDEIKKNRYKVMKWVRRWKKLIKSELGNMPIWDKESIWATVAVAVFGIIYSIAGFFATIKISTWGLILIGSGFLLTNLSFLMLRYTKEVKAIRSRLLSLQKYLKKYEFKTNPAVVQQNFSKYLAYGIALGMGTKAMKTLIDIGVSDPSRNYLPYFVTTAHYSTPAEFTKSISSLITSVNSTLSSASGTGGGASTGGGGGAGGASGGAG